MKKLNIFLIALLFVSLLITGCGDYYAEGDDSKTGGGGGYDGGYSSPESSYDKGADSDGGDPGENQNKGPKPGQLTAGEWSDIKNYDFYLNLFNIDDDPDVEESQRRISFSKYINFFGFETRFMVTVNVDCDDLPVNDAEVKLIDFDQNLLFTAKTDARGNAYLFPDYDLTGEEIIVIVKSGDYEKSQTLVYDPREDLQITLTGRDTKQSVLDLMFVIDTTGSMGDEIRYLKSEIEDVIGKISTANPNLTINLALLFYRDIGDDYVTRYFDFTTNISQQKSNLSKQSANGGGDFPEAADRALSEAVAKKWSAENATRLIFHVCDAPPHDKQENQTVFFNAVKTAAQKGIRIIPVASSGIDLNTEFLLRQEALMTGGTYIFLTDDSGVGNSHLEPTIGEYIVEYLNACMVRVVNEYLTGAETEPVPYYE